MQIWSSLKKKLATLIFVVSFSYTRGNRKPPQGLWVAKKVVQWFSKCCDAPSAVCILLIHKPQRRV